MSVIAPPLVEPRPTAPLVTPEDGDALASVTALRPEAQPAAHEARATGVDPGLLCLPQAVDVAPTADERCDHAEGGLPCVRRPHPEHPHAHVRVAGSRCNALAGRDEPAPRRTERRTA